MIMAISWYYLHANPTEKFITSIPLDLMSAAFVAICKVKDGLIFEIGNKQVEYSKYFLMMNGFYVNKICKDIRSIPRVIVSTKIF